jgi:hypothetical protein
MNIDIENHGEGVEIVEVVNERLSNNSSIVLEQGGVSGRLMGHGELCKRTHRVTRSFGCSIIQIVVIGIDHKH